MLLEDKIVVVIGGSSGIGLAVARQARAEGASLVIVGRDPAKVSDAASTLGGDTQGVVGDAHDHAALEKFVTALPEFDHLVSMIGNTMAGELPADAARHDAARTALEVLDEFADRPFRCASHARRRQHDLDLGKRCPGAGGGGELRREPGARRHGARTGFGTRPPCARERRCSGLHGHGLVANEAT